MVSLSHEWLTGKLKLPFLIVRNILPPRPEVIKSSNTLHSDYCVFFFIFSQAPARRLSYEATRAIGYGVCKESIGGRKTVGSDDIEKMPSWAKKMVGTGQMPLTLVWFLPVTGIPWLAQKSFTWICEATKTYITSCDTWLERVPTRVYSVIPRRFQRHFR